MPGRGSKDIRLFLGNYTLVDTMLQFFLEFDDFGGGRRAPSRTERGRGVPPCIGAYQFLVEIDDFQRARRVRPSVGKGVPPAAKRAWKIVKFKKKLKQETG